MQGGLEFKAGIHTHVGRRSQGCKGLAGVRKECLEELKKSKGKVGTGRRGEGPGELSEDREQR